VRSGSRFYNNYAEQRGGAIDCEVQHPAFDKDTQFFNNKAEVYGNNIGAFSQILAVISEDLYVSTLKKFGIIKEEPKDRLRMLGASSN